MKRALTDPAREPEPESIAQQRLLRPGPTFLGHSAAARRVQALIERAVRTPVPVLIVGPTGSGRLTIARMIHHFGGGEVPQVDIVRPAATGPIVGLSAFTYLADLEDLSKEEQRRLPALVGANRLVIATQLDPDSPAGRRRLDPRVVRWAAGGIRIDVPPLAERSEDIEMLVMEAVGKTPARHPIGSIADEALDCLRTHTWPGQFDEFRAVLAEAVARASTSQLDLRDLPARLRVRDTKSEQVAEPEAHLNLQHIEKRAIRRALAYARGNRRKAAMVLGIGKTTLYRKLREYGLD